MAIATEESPTATIRAYESTWLMIVGSSTSSSPESRAMNITPAISITAPTTAAMFTLETTFGNVVKSGMYGIWTIDQIIIRMPHMTHIHPKLAITALVPVSYTHLTLPTNR